MSEARAASAPGRALAAALPAVEAALERAAATGALREEALLVAGVPVRLRVAGRRYARLVDLALGHLRAPASARGDARPLTIAVVDEAEVGVALPPAAFAAGGAGRRVATAAPADGPGVRALLDEALPALSLLDDARGLAVHWLRDAALLPWWATASPLLTILAWALAARGRAVLHGGGVGTAAGGALLAGKGGSGKSTTALACLDRSALAFAGDDHVAVDLDGPLARVHALHATAKLHWGHAARFPRLAPLVTNEAARARDEKALVGLLPAAAARLGSGFPVRAILLPRVAAERAETRVAPATRAEALRALAPSTLFQLPELGAATLATLRALVERAPAFHLALGSEVEGIPPAIEALLARLAPADAAPARAPALEEAARG